MVLSKFNVFIDNIIFNTLTGYAMELDKDEIERLKKGDVPDHLKDIIEEGFSSGDEDLQDLVESISKKPVLEPTLLLTYNCNFDCVYCFQKGFRRAISVSENVMRGFVNYIKRKEGGRKVRVTFFGGEPLLELRKIEDISKSLSGLKYSFSVVTNGSLLTKSVAERLISLGLSHVQITLDGPREVHDKRRHYLDGRGSYEVILNNLRNLQDMVNVILRINVDVKNLDEVDVLFSELRERGITNIRLDPHFVHSNVFRNEWWDNVIPRDQEAEVLERFWEKARAHGFKIPHDVFRLGLCVAHVDEDVVVDPEGRVYPCWAFSGNPLYVKGRLTEQGDLIILNERLIGKNSLILSPKCKTCPFLPLCMGGCRFLSMLEGKGYHGLDCRRETYERLVNLVSRIMR
ncbi:MAG: radical SAM protein [Metallosphaera sp.]|uniref:radical SAM/SPASM domain-containing protein n=1 Tax=Metallosphaera sp. TaxID=2020860 RepID=UPI0031676353